MQGSDFLTHRTPPLRENCAGLRAGTLVEDGREARLRTAGRPLGVPPKWALLENGETDWVGLAGRAVTFASASPFVDEKGC
jgi:hypothetical protein